jgi:sugar (glycoside-pentoside-hexuronide) transporter
VGEAALNFMVAGISNYLLFYYTDVLGLAAGAAGLLMLIGRIWDACNDPIMGIWVDRTETRWGKFRPFLLFGAVPVAVLTGLAFSTPDLGPTGKLIWAYVTFILWSMAFTAVAVPYNAMLVNLTDDFQERTSLSAVKTMFAVAGSLLVVVLAKPMAESLGSDLQTGYALTFWIFGGGALLLLLICFASTQERTVPRAALAAKAFGWEQFRTITQNRPLILLVVFFILFQIAFSLFRTVELYYFTYVLGRGEHYPSTMLGAHLCAGIGMALMPWLVRQLDKKLAALAGCALGSLFLLVIYMVPESLGWTIVAICLSYLFLAIPFALFFGIVPDTVEYGQWKTGIRAAGLVFSTLTFAQKCSMAIAVAVGSWVLEAVGYAAGQIQTEFAVRGIAWLRTLLPMALFLLGMLPFLFYDLDRRRHARVLEEIESEGA